MNDRDDVKRIKELVIPLGLLGYFVDIYESKRVKKLSFCGVLSCFLDSGGSRECILPLHDIIISPPCRVE